MNIIFGITLLPKFFQQLVRNEDGQKGEMTMRRKIIVLCTVLSVAIGSTLIVKGLEEIAGAASTASVSPNEWPSFTMVYEDWRLGSNDEQPQVQAVKLIYHDKRHWKTELLAHNDAVDVVGTWAEYHGAEMRSFDPRTGELRVDQQDIPEDAVYVPEQWLIPGIIPRLLTQQNAEQLSGSSGGLAVLVLEENLPCQAPTEAMFRAGIQPCDSEYRVSRREITYRESDFLPVGIVDSLDGVEVHRVTVTELVMKNGEE